MIVCRNDQSQIITHVLVGSEAGEKTLGGGRERGREDRNGTLFQLSWKNAHNA